MFFTILFILLFAGLAVAVLLLLAPFRMVFGFSVKGLDFGGSGSISYLHPRILSVTFTGDSPAPRIRILGRQFGKRGKKKTAETPGSSARPVDRTETAARSDAAEQPAATAVPVETASERVVSSGEGAEVDSDTPGETPQTGSSGVSSRQQPAGEPVAVSLHSSTATEDAPAGAVPRQSTLSPVSTEGPQPSEKEKVEPAPKKKDNWYRRLERNRYFFFIKNGKWRSKIIRWLFRVIGTLLRIVHFDRFDVAVHAGVCDPVITGTMAGFYQAVLHGFQMKKPYLFTFKPAFMTNHFECSGNVRVGTSLGRVLMPVFVAVVTFPLLHTLRLVWCVYRRERRWKRAAPI